MKEMLSASDLHHFTESLIQEAKTLEEAQEMISTAVSFVADKLHLGRVLVMLDTPPSVFDLKGTKETQVVYAGFQGYDAEPIERKFSLVNKGTLQLTWYPVKGYTWSDDEKRYLEIIMDYIYLRGLGVRVGELLSRSAFVDSMTGANNTQKLMQYGTMLEKSRRLSEFVALFENIKNFRYINRFYGDRNGDYILKEFVRIVFFSLNAEELIVRLGGDNFVVLVKKQNLDAHLELLSKLKIRLQHAGLEQDVEIPMRCGIYHPIQGDQVGDLLMCSSAALQYAKRTAAEQFVYFKPGMLEYSIRAKEVSVLFPKAINEREFEAFYQPKVNLETGQLCGAEALVRWRRGGIVVPPGDFVPILEQEGTICTLDYYMLDLVCRNQNKWRQYGLDPVPVSVNFSKLHLHESNFAERILSIIDENSVNRSDIEIELTEESGYEDFAALSDFVDTMNANGVATSIDDFGTGYSSLNIVKNLHTNVIKLDKSFLDNIRTDKEQESDVTLICAVIKLVRDLGMEVLAEGIELPAQVEFLREQGCNKAQGYFFDKPLSEVEYQTRLLGKRIYPL
ncbi:MAG: bifunctional diguanylate cyclase/phosphodiesterase [Lachnospiraceae bacterium]|nr:bifunctional diguanylate cyclase/phosphodiesterase [Lachnospiraceae bacterium]